MNETRDLVEYTEFEIVIRSCLKESFEVMLEQLKQIFYPDPSFTVSRSLPLASVLPKFTKMAHQVINGVPNIHVDVR